MNPRLGWLLAAILALSNLGQAWQMAFHTSGFAVLPIFVPVTLEYEKQLRAQRQQPPSRSGEQLLSIASALQNAALPQETYAALRPEMNALFETRAQLMEVRARRHLLNVALMNVAVEIVQELTPEQWEKVYMHRDELRARMEAEVFERLSRKMGP